MTRTEHLALLVEEQAKDDATDRLWPDAHAIRESEMSSPLDGGPDCLDRLVNRRALEPVQQLADEEAYIRSGQAMLAPPVRPIGSGVVWTPPIIHYHATAKCPVCKDKPIGKKYVCLCCHASGLDPQRHDMMETPKQAQKREKLAGGKGATLTPGKRGRKKLWADFESLGKV